MSTEKLARAHNLLEQGKLSEAETQYREILALEPGHASAHHGLARVALASDQPAAAAELLQKALHAEPGNPDHWLALARALTLAGFPDDAGKVLAEGQAAGVLGDDSGPKAELPHHAKKELADANKAASRGQFRRAEKIMADLVRRWPEHFEVQQLLGKILARQQKHREAIEPLYEAHKLDRKNTEVLAILGSCLQSLRQLGDARKCFEQVLAMEPDNAGVHNQLASVLHSLNEDQSALEHAERALAIKPDFPSALINKGNALRGLKRTDAAREAYQQARHLQPDYFAAEANLGTVDRDDGHTLSARDHYKRSLELKPDQPDILHNLGSVHMDLGEPEEALACYREAARLAPHRIETLEAVGDLTTWADAEDKHLQALTEALDAGHLPLQEQVFAGFALGKALLDLGEEDAAFQRYQQANLCARKLYGKHQPELAIGLLKVFGGFMKPGFLEKRKDFGDTDACEIFVMGFSRSGKSLVESLITGDPDITPCREQRDFMVFGHSRLGAEKNKFSSRHLINYIRELEADESRREAARYLDQYNPERMPRTLTNPGNLPLLGFLPLWMPKTPIIFCRRDLMDLGLSCYFKRYAQGHEYSYDLAALGQEIRLNDAFIDLWLEYLPNPMLEVHYEDVVRQPEQTARTIHEFLGREWKPEYLDVLDTRQDLAAALGPAGSVDAPMALRDDFIGFSKPFHHRLEPLVKGYESINIKKTSDE
ncbi:tetratricopeptide repeat protein [Wenzhouxiangella sp. AB-CW3]|uniref:tetratricopeptide repeat-containing sulfotransferase family protein n=1 Tax=Wenzhouxiangella sp. AB-CW3 TaxID=2771012 RepID=UPI00168B9916|nr:tetratricopeptide repeat-containing sulfotransferase family protein [Wenzhouxiangella sp. AB-CW3]QOC21217.1 tetratricopeptide repeat protein [Wenzhouxiangella sp. AB-CW3]